MHVSTIDDDDLYDMLMDSVDAVKRIMVKKDNLTDRLANQYAAIYLTVELLNQAFGYNLSPDQLLERLIKCEQDSFEERDNGIKAYHHIIDFIARHESHFIVDRRYMDKSLNFDDMCKPKDIYGKIIKYDKLWEVHLLQDITKKVLTEKELGCEIQAIRKKWIERGITKGDTDHNTKQYSHTGKRARYDCFMVKGGIQEPDSDEDVMIEPEEQQEIPISDYTIDDSSAIDEVFGGQDDNN